MNLSNSADADWITEERTPNVYLIQVSGHEIAEKASLQYIEATKGPRYCDEPLVHHQYHNASPFWMEEGYGRRDAWKTVVPGDRVLLYGTSNVDAGAGLSHVLDVVAVELHRDAGAWLRFDEPQPLDPLISYGEIQRLVRDEKFSVDMNRCGQEGFNFTRVERTDLTTARTFSG